MTRYTEYQVPVSLVPPHTTPLHASGPRDQSIMEATLSTEHWCGNVSARVVPGLTELRSRDLAILSEDSNT